MASFIRVIFCRAEGEDARFVRDGAPNGGNIDADRGPVGEVYADEAEEPQFEQTAELGVELGEDDAEMVDVGVLLKLRDTGRDGGVDDECGELVNVKV
jgi:hypothetical protein